MQCFPFANDDTSYNCAAYLLSPVCYERKFGIQGLELGTENQPLKDMYYSCLVTEGVLGE